jgi:hypothetical protein
MTMIFLRLSAVALLAGALQAPAIAQTTQSTQSVGPAAPRISPFQAVRWQTDTPQVQVDGTWYELVSLDDAPADQIVSYCKTLDARNWQRLFSQDLISVLVKMAVDPGVSTTANLQVKDLQSGQVKTLTDVPMTAENETAIMVQNHDFAKLSPFESVRWMGTTPQVKVGGKFYDLVALDDVPVETIVSFCQRTYTGPDPNWWQKRFDEDLVEVLSTMGKPPAANVTLKLMTLNTQEEQTLENVPMTEENRRAILEDRRKIR